MQRTEYILKEYGERIEQVARSLGFYVVDLQVYIMSKDQLVAPLALKGAVKRYAHWTFGKQAEIFNKWIKQEGLKVSALDLLFLTTLPELPLLGSPPLHEQISAIARAYAKIDFMHTNNTWSARDFGKMWVQVEEHVKIVDEFNKSPAIGKEKVEQVLTAAHSIMYQCSHALALQGRSSDCLLEIAGHSPKIHGWQRDLLRIVHREWVWFLPLIETQLMMKGYASFWQMPLIGQADLPVELKLDCVFDFLNEIAIPVLAGAVNPSLVGYRIFEEICKDGCQSDVSLFRKKVEEIIKDGNDPLFIAKQLTHLCASRCGLFSWGQKGRSKEDAKILEVKELSDLRGWQKVRDELVLWLGGNAFPAIRITQNNTAQFRMRHEFDGRTLDKGECMEVLAAVRELLGVPVYLETIEIDGNGKARSVNWNYPAPPSTYPSGY